MISRKIIFIFLILLFPSALFSQQYQVSGKVVDSITGSPLAFVNIVSPDGFTSVCTDVDGKFSLRMPDENMMLIFSYVGYYQRNIAVHAGDKLLVKMFSRSFEIKGVEVFPGENPAHRIITKVLENRNINNPLKNVSFSCYAYNKFVIEPDPERVKVLSDSLPADTIIQKVKAFSEKTYFFIMESVSERKFSLPDKSSETIKTYKVSGFEDPLFALLMTQVQSFTFYDDFISIFDIRYVNPISPGSLSRYYFQLEDTLYQGKDSVFIISYRPFIHKNFIGLKGLLYINNDGYAIQNVIAESAIADGNKVKIQQLYEKIDDRQWFPVQLNTDISIDFIKVNNLEMVGSGKTYIRDIVLDSNLKRRDVGNAVVEIDAVSSDEEEKLWDLYREQDPVKKDTSTYIMLDSIGKKMKLDNKLQGLNTILSGKIPVKFLDIDIGKILNYNKHELFRLGLGLHTNQRMSRVFSFGGYLAYGFGDKQLKYGGDMQFVLQRRSATSLGIYYFSDLYETGAASFYETESLFSSEWIRSMSLKRFDNKQGVRLDIQTRPFPSAKIAFYASLSDITANYSYDYQETPPDSLDFRFSYRDASLGVMLRFAWGEKVIRNVHYDMVLKNDRFPVLYVTYIRGIKGVFGSDFNYNKFDIRLTKVFVSKYSGTTRLNLLASYTDRSLPLSLLNAAKGSNGAYYLEASNSFSTMNPGEFYSNLMLSLFARHDFPGFFKKRHFFDPHFSVIFNCGWGRLMSKENHRLTEIMTPEYIYPEAGLMANSIINLKFISFGAGVYYLFGYYSDPELKKNFYPRWNIKMNLF